jgi:deoxyribodipyrimidine photo-lyase
MWFASIWIFTLNLPWQLGAALFQKYLVDFDAASNTLSWRWVAGIQTAGKHYIARAENINKFTEGRYNPVGLLNENPRPIVEKGDYQRSAYPSCGNLAESVSGVLLLFEENLMLPEQLLDFGFDKLIIIRNSDFKGEAEKFSRACTESIKVTLSETKDVLVEVQGFENDFDQKNSYLSSYLFQGPAKDYLSESSMLEKTTQFRNSWDEKYHPSAKAGYFKFRKAWQKELSGS